MPLPRKAPEPHLRCGGYSAQCVIGEVDRTTSREAARRHGRGVSGGRWGLQIPPQIGQGIAAQPTGCRDHRRYRIRRGQFMRRRVAIQSTIRLLPIAPVVIGHRKLRHGVALRRPPRLDPGLLDPPLHLVGLGLGGETDQLEPAVLLPTGAGVPTICPSGDAIGFRFPLGIIHRPERVLPSEASDERKSADLEFVTVGASLSHCVLRLGRDPCHRRRFCLSATPTAWSAGRRSGFCAWRRERCAARPRLAVLATLGLA